MINTPASKIAHLIRSEISSTMHGINASKTVYDTSEIAKMFHEDLERVLEQLIIMHAKAGDSSKRIRDRILGKKFQALLDMAGKLARECDVYLVRRQAVEISEGLAIMRARKGVGKD